MSRDRWQSAVYSPSDAGGGDPPSPAPVPPPPPPPPPPSPPAQQQRTYEEPGAKRTPADQIAELRAEAAQWRIVTRQAESARDEALTAAQTARDSLEYAKTTAVAPLTAKLEKARKSVMDTAIQSELVSLGLQDTDLIGLASKMPEAPKVELDDEFVVVGAKEFAAAFKKWKPQFFKDATTGGGTREPPKTPGKTGAGREPDGAGGDPPVIDVKGMDPKAYAAYRAGILRGIPRTV